VAGREAAKRIALTALAHANRNKSRHPRAGEDPSVNRGSFDRSNETQPPTRGDHFTQDSQFLRKFQPEPTHPLEYIRNNPGYRSIQSGLRSSIKAIFHARNQCFIAFSRAIAYSMMS
jgi:hypothetical protein